MGLTDEQTKVYKQTLEVTRTQIDELNEQIEEELAKVKERLADLQARKNAARQIYDGACRMLGIENDLGPAVSGPGRAGASIVPRAELRLTHAKLRDWDTSRGLPGVQDRA